MRSLLLIGAGVLVLGFLVTAYFLLSADFQKGDVYSAYSSMRSAPTGTRVLYEALEGDGKKPGRNLLSLPTLLAEQPPEELLFIGYDGKQLVDRDDLLDKYVQGGGHLILGLEGGSTFDSDYKSDDDDKDKSDKPDDADKDKDKSSLQPSAEEKADAPGPNATEQELYERKQEKDDREIEQKHSDQPIPYQRYVPTLMARWGFGLMSHLQGKSEVTDDDKVQFDTFPKDKPPGAENSLPWSSPNYFVRVDPAWKILYSVEHRPVALDRAIGKGHITIMTDSYLFTNKAMRTDPRPGFLNWLVGFNSVFDETHLGVQQTQEVSTFILHFRLEGYILGAALVFILYIWRNSYPLQPIQTDEIHSITLGKLNTVAGRDARNGLINLLKRNLPETRLLVTCLDEWKRAQGALALKAMPAKVLDLEHEASRPPTSQKDLIDSYKRLVQLVGKKKQ